MKKIMIYFLLFTAIAITENKKTYSQTKFYVKAGMAYTSIGGGFDGKSVLTGNGITILIPKLKPNFGYEVCFGGWIKPYETFLSIKYSKTKFDATFEDLSLGKANYNVIGLLEFTGFLPYSKTQTEATKPPKIRVYMKIGFDLGNLRVKESYFEPDTIPLSTNYGWMGLPVGTGLAFNFMGNSFITLGINYRITVSNGVSGVGTHQSYEIEKFGGMGALYGDIGILYTIPF
jgi:hypothetical protein